MKQKDYKDLTDILKQNKIPFRWEFPQGVTFTFKDKKHRLTKDLKVKQFLRRYRNDLQISGDVQKT